MDQNDNGYQSRKLHMAYATLVLVCLGFCATGVWPALIPAFPEFLTALIAATSIYSGANVMAKKVLKDSSVAEDPPVPPT